MPTQNDLLTVYEFIKSTGENNIRKIMTGPKMTNHHVGVLLKVVRTSKPEEFAQFCETNTFPKMKFTNDEAKLKDTFWKTACDCFVQMGLATAGSDAPAAKPAAPKAA
jgi:hypothetical protein